jgi:hypothetical protein
MSKNSFK